MKDTYKIIDNFLEKEKFKALQDFMFSRELPWFYTSNLNTNQNKNVLHSYFEHHFYNSAQGGNSPFFNLIAPLLEKIENKVFFRVKGNLYPRTNELETHASHCDFPWKHKACLFSINTCDGETVLANGEKIKSIENRILFFEAYKPHASTSTTNAKARINININYF
jgi:hypothetical protein